MSVCAGCCSDPLPAYLSHSIFPKEPLYSDGLEWAEAPQLALDQNLFWGWKTCGNNLNPCMRLVLRGQSPSPGWDETEEHFRLVYCQCFKSVFFYYRDSSGCSHCGRNLII